MYPTGDAYSFSYGVKDGYTYNDFGHQETSDGQVVTGAYRVLLPDGREQTVTYTVDDYSGYVAKVKYENLYTPRQFGHPAAYAQY